MSLASFLFRQFTVPAVGQLLGVAGDSGQRRAQLQRHLGGNLAMQLLLAANALQLAEIVEQAGDTEQAAIDGRVREKPLSR